MTREEPSWEVFLKDLKQQCEDNNGSKTISVIVFCEEEDTLKQFLKYIDAIDGSSNSNLLQEVPVVLSPIGYYTKEITTDQGWQVELNISCMPPPWKTTSIDLIPLLLKSEDPKSSMCFILLVDWVKEDQSYWLEDMNELFTKCNQIQPDVSKHNSLMMINSDYCKHLETTHARWSASTVDFMHQSLRIMALNLGLSIYSDKNDSVLATKSATGILLTGEERKELSDLVHLESLNIIQGSDSLSKISMIDESFLTSAYSKDLDKLRQDYANTIPQMKTRDNKATVETSDTQESVSIPDVQEQLEHLYNLQKKQSSTKRLQQHQQQQLDSHQSVIQETITTAIMNGGKSDYNNEPLKAATISPGEDDDALDSLVDNIVQRHQMS